MSSTKIDSSKVLIVPGYTASENLLKSNKKTANQVVEPTSFLFEAQNVQSQPHRPSYEEFRSSDGLLMLEKHCDEFAVLTLDILVHQNLSDSKGSFVIDKKTREARIRTTNNSAIKDNGETDDLFTNVYVSPEDYTDEYIEVRANFFKDLLGRPLTVVSPLFEAIPVCYITDYSYNIAEGEEVASYSVTFSEIAAKGF